MSNWSILSMQCFMANCVTSSLVKSNTYVCTVFGFDEMASRQDVTPFRRILITTRHQYSVYCIGSTHNQPSAIWTTEFWLRDQIHDNIVSISKYTLVRRRRVWRIFGHLHGGFCTYIRKTIRFKILEDLSNEHLEVI